MYCHDILALDAIIHSASLSLYLIFFFTNAHYTVCVCEYPLFKSYFCLFFFVKGCEE